MEPYDGGWCRPQNDGPALRAMALCKYGFLLLDAGEDISRIWDIVSFDLEWVLENWFTDGCDLWEEVNSDDFYWNRQVGSTKKNKGFKLVVKQFIGKSKLLQPKLIFAIKLSLFQ